MPTRKNADTVEPVGEKLVIVGGWMKRADREKLKKAIESHPQFKTVSEFVNCAAEALLKANHTELAQPLRFLTMDQRDRLKLAELIDQQREQWESVQGRPKPKSRYALNEPPAKYRAKKKGGKA